MGNVLDDPLGGVGWLPTCKHCGSPLIAKDAHACFNPSTGLWELEQTLEREFCKACNKESGIVWKEATLPNIAIRQLNDALRMEGRGNGQIFVTAGINERGPDFVLATSKAVCTFNTFDDNNDPWGEHDFGAVEVAGEKIFWKIDYYNQTLTAGSENPANEGVTMRVLTIMLASEY